MKASPVSPAAEAGTELHLFGNSAGQAGVEFGLKAFFIVEKAPWVEHVDGRSARPTIRPRASSTSGRKPSSTTWSTSRKAPTAGKP